jgi:hypothetical protein
MEHAARRNIATREKDANGEETRQAQATKQAQTPAQKRSQTQATAAATAAGEPIGRAAAPHRQHAGRGFLRSAFAVVAGGIAAENGDPTGLHVQQMA